MTRRIVQLAGARAEFALADDGSIWLWTGMGWQAADRGPLPQPETIVAGAEVFTNDHPLYDRFKKKLPFEEQRKQGGTTDEKPVKEAEGPRRAVSGLGEAPPVRDQGLPDGPGVRRDQEVPAPRKRGRPPRHQ